MLPIRPCTLREEDHRYVWDSTGEEMGISVTGVINHDKPPYDGPAEAAWRGTHVHRQMQALACGNALLNPMSPEGIDCTAWFNQLEAMTFWNEIQTLACEFTMVHRRKSLGGQLDLLCKYKGKTLLVDLKTKSDRWTGASKEDRYSYAAQAGAYGYLLDSGDGAQGGCWVDECRTLVVTPNKTQWLSKMTPEECFLAWEERWDSFCAGRSLTPF